MFSAMLTEAFRDEDVGVNMKYRTDGKLRRRKTKTKVMKDIRDLLFSDDGALNSVSEADMQRSVNLFSSAFTNFGLTINTKKTDILHQTAPGRPFVEPNITVNGKRLTHEHWFTYLGSTLSQNVTIDGKVNVRIARSPAPLLAGCTQMSGTEEALTSRPS